MNSPRLLDEGLRTIARPLKWPDTPLVPLAHLYGLVMQARAALYGCGALKQRVLPCRVISVGNVTVGGTGKTPVVISLANVLREKGYHPGVISRGYGRSREDLLVEVSDGRQTICRHPMDTGDEPLLIAERCPGVPVAVGADRYRTGRYLLDRYHPDTLVLDDGFQHLALHRNADIVVLDATSPFGNGYPLPCGRLREPLSAMGRASLLLLTRARQAKDCGRTVGLLKEAMPGIPIGITDFQATTVCKLGTARVETVSVLKEQPILAVSGIGNPASFERQLEDVGAVVRKHLRFPDHHAYTRDDVLNLAELAEKLDVSCVVTTEKDAVKLKCFEEISAPKLELWALRIEMDWLEGQEEWERIVLSN